MTIVFVHGNPETAAVWEPLVARLREKGVEEPVLLSPPGFGAPVPDGWGATAGEYRDWLIAELERLDGPIDLVGHDWGGAHVVNAVIERPDLVRSWCTDVLGAFDPDYVWHDLAQIWQTPGQGEKAVAQMVGAPADQRARGLIAGGMTPEVAAKVSAAIDATMGDCILKLYRSAAPPAMAEQGKRLEALTARPGLSIDATEDRLVGTEEQIRRTAQRAGAQVARLDGLNHWWMTEDPDRGAEALTRFWNGL